MEDVDPDALGRPSDEPIVEGFARSIDRRCIDPSAARFQHMHDATDHSMVINPRLASGIGRQKRLQPGELLLGQPEMIAIHQGSPFGDRESQSRSQRNPLYGSGP